MSLRLEKVDWKFVITAFLTIIAIAAPMWLWRADLDAKGIDMTLLGSFELVSPISKSQQGLRILYNGKDLKNPFSSIITVSNSGAKPIQVSDFDGPIKITIAKPAKLLRSQIVRRLPLSLEPVVSTNEQMLTIDPMLLNPGDLIAFEMLTTGGKPQFTSRGRIAGVPDVIIEESQSKDRMIISTFGFSFGLNKALGCLLIIYASFGAIYALFAGSIAYRIGTHSKLVHVLGVSSISTTSLLLMRILFHFAFGTPSTPARVIFVFASLGAGALSYKSAIRLFPVKR
jgi:hypothetical protein